MRFQQNSLILAALLSSFGVTVPAASMPKDVTKMTVGEVGKLDPKGLTTKQKAQLYYTARFSGMLSK